MKSANGTEVIAKPYREEDAEEIVNLIIRNFKEINVKDYGEETVAELVATHDVNWFIGLAEYANVYVFWKEMIHFTILSASDSRKSELSASLIKRKLEKTREFQGKGIAQKAILLCEEVHGNKNWELDTILQEQKNCHLYEKMGYRQTGKTKVINERLTLTFYEKRRQTK